MVRTIVIISLFILLLSACKSQNMQQNNNVKTIDNISTEIIDDNVSDNSSNDNESIKNNNLNETIIDVFINSDGEKITKIYKSNNQYLTKHTENQEIIQLLSQDNEDKCINWIIDALNYHNINDNLLDTYINYNDIYLYEPVVLHIALICNSAYVFNMLIDYGADVFAEDNEGVTIKSLAEQLNNEEIIEIITKEYENGL